MRFIISNEYFFHNVFFINPSKFHDSNRMRIMLMTVEREPMKKHLKYTKTVMGYGIVKSTTNCGCSAATVPSRLVKIA